VPIAAHGTVSAGQLRLVGFIASVDGKRSVRGEISGEVTECEQLGIRLADQLLAEGGKEILEEVYHRSIGE
jgi:hydroxymethylbilane synthase